MRGIRIEGEPPSDWRAEAKAVTDQLYAAELTPISRDLYDLQLQSQLSNESEIHSTGTSTVVIADVAGRIRIRVFDDSSVLTVDAAQPKRDVESSLFNQLAGILQGNWDRSQLKSFELTAIFGIAEKIVRRWLTDEIIEKNQELWRDDRVRNWLLSQFNYKCWYSEAQDSVSSCHVDHFRPKGRVTDDVSKEVSDGYWWLAFDWTNYRIGGQLLNVKKSDRFPFADQSRATHDDPDSIRKECPILLDPLHEEEARLISYEWEEEESCIAVPAAGTSQDAVSRVDRTIEILGLNRVPQLRRKRAEFWEECQMVIADYKGATGPQCFALIEQTKARTRLREMTDYNAEFSSVAEACIRKNAPEPLVASVFSG